MHIHNCGVRSPAQGALVDEKKRSFNVLNGQDISLPSRWLVHKRTKRLQISVLEVPDLTVKGAPLNGMILTADTLSAPDC